MSIFNIISAPCIQELVQACYDLDQLICFPTGTSQYTIDQWHREGNIYDYIHSQQTPTNWSHGLNDLLRLLENGTINRLQFDNRLGNVIRGRNRLYNVIDRVRREFPPTSFVNNELLEDVDYMVDVLDSAFEQLRQHVPPRW